MGLFGFILILITPTLWAVVIAQLLLVSASSVLVAVFYAFDLTCSTAVDQLRSAMVEAAAATGADQNVKNERVAERERQNQITIVNILESLDSATGTGISGAISDARYCSRAV